MMGRSRIILCAVLVVVAGCRTQRQQPAPVASAPRAHRTFEIRTDTGVDTTIAVRDLFTGEQLTLESRRGLLVLRAAAGIIDTLRAPERADSAAPAITQVDSSFVQLSSGLGDSTSSTTIDLVGVAGGALHWSARLPRMSRLPGAEAHGVHSTSYSILRSPLALAGSEMFSPTMSESGAPTPWSAPFDLRFDDSSGAFYNVSIALDSVPVLSGPAAMSGRYPGIALRLGTSVLIEGRWYSLSLPEDLDPEELARGTVGLVLEGKGEWGDTLRPLAVRGMRTR